MLTGLGGPARFYPAIGHIRTRSFYETPGATLPNALPSRAANVFAGPLCIDRHAASGHDPGRCSCSRAYLPNCTVPRTAILRAYHTGHPAPSGDAKQTAAGGDTPRYCSHEYQTHYSGQQQDEVLRAHMPDTVVLIVRRPPERPWAMILLLCMPDTLPQVAINKILLLSQAHCSGRRYYASTHRTPCPGRR